MTFDEDFVPISPVNFFQLNVDAHQLSGSFPSLNKKNYRKYLLPDTSSLCGETPFAEIALGWDNDGIEIYAQIDTPFQRAFYPDIQRGDSVELFFDTRDVKTSGFNTRFCHHFFFLAEGVDGQFMGELTRFRTEDAHPLCNPNDLKIKVLNQRTNYSLSIFIPRHCLHGYDPEQFNRMGFTYRINRAEGFPQHFSVATDDYQIEQQPSLWGSVKLVK